MYTEGYITKIKAMTGQSPISIYLDPPSPYKLKDNDSVGVLALKAGCSLPKIVDSSSEAQVYPSENLELTCEDQIADLAALVTIKASHLKICVSFDKTKVVSEMNVL